MILSRKRLVARAAFLLALVGLLFVSPWPVLADYVDDEELEIAVRQAEEELFAQKEKLRKVQDGLERQLAAAESVRHQQEQLLDELASFDEQIIEESRLLVEYFHEAQVEREATREKEQVYKRAQLEKEMLRAMTQQRLASYYRTGDIGLLNVTFSASSLPELVTFHEYYHHLLRHDHQLIERYRQKIAELAQARESHLQQEKELQAAMDRARQQRDSLSVAKEERRILLGRLQSLEELHKGASRRLAAAAETLMDDLRQLEQQAEMARLEKEEWMVAAYPLLPFKKRKPAWMRGFGGQQGKLPIPVAGEVLSRGAGQPEAGPEAEVAPGLDFKVEAGSQVRAIFRGKVIYAGFVEGYGQMVVISHTDNYYTMTGGLASFLVEVGDMVERGSLLGLATHHVGELQTPIHFEIRLKSQPLEPLEWLDPDLLVQAAAGQQTAFPPEEEEGSEHLELDAEPDPGFELAGEG